MATEFASTKFTNPVAREDGEGSGSDEDTADMFDSEPQRVSPRRRSPHKSSPSPLPATLSAQSTFDAESADRTVMAESMQYFSANELEMFKEGPGSLHMLCEGLAQCQFKGKKYSPFTTVWLTLDSECKLTLKTVPQNLPGHEGASQGKVLSSVSALWCTVARPKTQRKRYPDAIKLDTVANVSGSGHKFILAVDAENSSSSGLTIAKLKAALTSCSYAKVNGNGLQLETPKERRLRETAEDMSESGMVLNPESPFRRKWDVVQILLLTYVAIVVPFRVGFTVSLDLWTLGFFFDAAVDIYFICDMFLSFQTAYYNERGQLETKTDRIFLKYMRTWFPVDFVACFPGKMIIYMTDNDSARSSSTGRHAVLNLTVLLKLLRLARLGRLISRYEAEFHEFLNRIQLFKLVLIMGFLGHWLCCLWFAIGSMETNAKDQYGDPVQGWVLRMWGTEGDSLATATTMERYLRSFYWAIMTMTTVGYGDIVPNTTLETVIAVAGMVVGGFVFALIVGSLSDLSKRANPGDVIREEKYGLVGAMLQDGPSQNLDVGLSRKIRAYYSNHYHKRTAMDFQGFILGCPPDLRDELGFQLQWLDGADRGTGELGLLSKMPFFAGVDPLSSILICSKMRTVLASPVAAEPDGTRSNLIMVEGTRAEQMYVVIRVEMEAEDPKPIVLEQEGAELGRLGMFDYFGELAALLPLAMKQHRTRTRTAFATSETHLGMLAHDDILQLCAERSEIAEKVIPYVNQVAASVLAQAPKEDASGSNDSNLLRQAQREGGKADASGALPRGPALTAYDIHPVLKAIQPTLNDFDARLKAIDEKLDSLLVAK